MARARSLTPFRGPAASAIGRIKYQGWTAPAQYLGERLARALAREPGLPKPDVVVAVPSTPGRVRERGFNPAELLARGVAEGLEIPLVAALERPLESPRQVGLPPSQRSTNVRGAFVPAASGSREVARRSVLLVDDVLTTGATAVEAADVLVACGAREVTLASVARALPEDPDFVGPQP